MAALFTVGAAPARPAEGPSKKAKYRPAIMTRNPWSVVVRMPHVRPPTPPLVTNHIPNIAISVS